MGHDEMGSKKRKRKGLVEDKHYEQLTSDTPKNTSKPTAIFKPTAGRDWTVSVALPGSIVANAQSHDLRTALAGHVARALSVFCVDEVVIFSDGAVKEPQPQQHRSSSQRPSSDPAHYTASTDPDHFLVHLLSYLETPPHLRRHLFPLHPNLRTAGTLPSLDLPHHLRADEWCPYREGVSRPSPVSPTANASTTLVDAGLRVPVTVESAIPASMRVTLRFAEDAAAAAQDPAVREIRAVAVDPAEPREEAGYYWGYSVRRANCLSAVFEECPFDGGYDVTIGTSERGHSLRDAPMDGIAPFRHLLLVLGGVAGLEAALAHDATLAAIGVVDVADLFDYWVNFLPGQGSRTIRTEEALWIVLMGVQGVLVRNADGGA